MDSQLLSEIKDPLIKSLKFIHDYQSDGEYSPKCKRCKKCDHYENDLHKFFSVEYDRELSEGEFFEGESFEGGNRRLPNSKKIYCYRCKKENNTTIELLCVSGFGIDYEFDQNIHTKCSLCDQKLIDIDENNILSISCQECQLFPETVPLAQSLE